MVGLEGYLSKMLLSISKSCFFSASFVGKPAIKETSFWRCFVNVAVLFGNLPVMVSFSCIKCIISLYVGRLFNPNLE